MFLTWRAYECGQCGQPFRVTGGGGGPMQDYEDIDCPHCGVTVASKKTAGVFQTHKLTPDEAAEYAAYKASTKK